MNCPRCQGKMRWEQLYTEDGYIPAWICLTCGEIIDPEILANREESLKRIRTKRSSEEEVIDADS